MKAAFWLLTRPRPTPCRKKIGRCSASVLSSPSSERSEEKESPRLWMMLLCRSSPALLPEHHHHLAILSPSRHMLRAIHLGMITLCAP